MTVGIPHSGGSHLAEIGSKIWVNWNVFEYKLSGHGTYLSLKTVPIHTNLLFFQQSIHDYNLLYYTMFILKRNKPLHTFLERCAENELS